MIDFQGKPLEQLNMGETIEFEKQMLKKVLAANKAQMGDTLINQINVFIELIRDHKRQLSQIEMAKQNEKEDGNVLEIGEIPLPPKTESIEEMLDFYKKK